MVAESLLPGWQLVILPLQYQTATKSQFLLRERRRESLTKTSHRCSHKALLKMGSVIQLPFFCQHRKPLNGITSTKTFVGSWILKVAVWQSDSLACADDQKSSCRVKCRFCFKCLFLFLSSFQHCLFLSVVEEKRLFFFEFLLGFFLSTIKGSKCCLSVHVTSLCARVRSLQVVTWTTKKKKLDINSAPHPLGHHIVKCELEVWFWWKHYLEFLDCCKTAQLHCG